jgi:hypothetical protein
VRDKSSRVEAKDLVVSKVPAGPRFLKSSNGEILRLGLRMTKLGIRLIRDVSEKWRWAERAPPLRRRTGTVS